MSYYHRYRGGRGRRRARLTPRPCSHAAQKRCRKGRGGTQAGSIARFSAAAAEKRAAIPAARIRGVHSHVS